MNFLHDNETVLNSEFTELYYLEDLVDFGADIDEIKSDYNHLDDDEFYCQSWIVLHWPNREDGNKNEFYHLSDFLRWDTPWTGKQPEEFEGYHGYKDDGYCGVVLIALSECGEGYRVNYCFS